MFLTLVILVAPQGEGDAPDPEIVHLALSRQAAGDQSIEHIRVRKFADEVRVGVLSLSTSQLEADRGAWDLCRTAVERDPDLAGWTLRTPTDGEPW